jgi:regulator of sigma E protease
MHPMSGFAFSLLAFVLALSPLVFLHELGHYLMAKACGVRVDSFSIGFGPQLLGWTDKAGTRWQISLFLLGGYVKMAGDENIASSVSSQGAKEATDTFESKSPWQKILIAVSGPFANYLTAFIILCPLFVLIGKPDSKPIIGQVVASSMAASAGLHEGDRITNVQDQPITRFGEMLTVLGNTPLTQNLKLHVVRDSIEKEVIVPSPSKEGVWKGNLGISPDPAFRTFFPLTLHQATTDVLTLMNPVKTIKSMSMDSMGGPIKIGQDAGRFLNEGWELFLYFVGMVSIALGFFNLLPFPLLDGGMVLFSVIEMVIRRPLPARVQQTVSFIAFLGLGSLFIYLSWKDLVSIPRVHEWLQALGLI